MSDWDEFVGEEDDREPPKFGCVLPGRCCMPGLHFEDECHTAEMMEQMYAEATHED